MVVTHLFQIMSFVAMEPPTSLQQRPLVAERTKVFDSMSPLQPDCLVRGQYEGYREEDGVAPDSDTETFVATRVYVDNWRWSGVPFFLRTGKRLAESHHLMTIAFRQPPRRMFSIDSRFTAESFGSDHLTFELGDPGSITATFLAKVPGPTLQLGEADMSFCYSTAFGGPEQALEAYERLLHDVMIGERTLFTPSEGIERLWEISEPVLENPAPVEPYAPGSWGPPSIERLIAPRAGTFRATTFRNRKRGQHARPRGPRRRRGRAACRSRARRRPDRRLGRLYATPGLRAVGRDGAGLVFVDPVVQRRAMRPAGRSRGRTSGWFVRHSSTVCTAMRPKCDASGAKRARIPRPPNTSVSCARRSAIDRPRSTSSCLGLAPTGTSRPSSRGRPPSRSANASLSA